MNIQNAVLGSIINALKWLHYLFSVAIDSFIISDWLCTVLAFGLPLSVRLSDESAY